MHRRQDHTVKDRQSLDCGQLGTVPWATNVCQCSQPWEHGTEAPEDHHRHAPTSYIVFSPCCSVVQSLHPSSPQPHRQSCQWGSSYPRKGVVKRLEHSDSLNECFWPDGSDFITVATWAFELEMHLRIKAEELPGGTVLQQITFQIREELRKCTFLERLNEMFYCFEIENLRIRILKGASAL